AGAKVDEATANVRRLADARAVLGPLGHAFQMETLAAEERRTLSRLRRDVEAAPIESAKKALAAEVLIAVADAPGGARVAIVDLASSRPLRRVEKRAEVPDVSSASAFHRNEIEACAIALAVRRSVE